MWAFWDTDTWTIVDKAILEEQSDSLPANLEKLIGFEGRPDPSSGTCPVCAAERAYLSLFDSDAGLTFDHSLRRLLLCLQRRSPGERFGGCPTLIQKAQVRRKARSDPRVRGNRRCLGSRSYADAFPRDAVGLLGRTDCYSRANG
jgi:hypothetical protein